MKLKKGVLLDLLHRLNQLADQEFRRHAGTVLTPRQYDVLAAVASAEDSNQTQVAGRLGMDNSTMALMVERLVKGGLLNRWRDSKDGRAFVPSLTSTGRIALETGEAAAGKAEEALLSNLTEQSRDELLAALRSVAGEGPLPRRRRSQSAGEARKARGERSYVR